MNDFKEIRANKFSRAKRKPIYGIGTNDADYFVCPIVKGKAVMCPFYRKWVDMIKRCYSERYIKQFPTYNDCLVCDDWLIFSKFKEWMINQAWQGKELDKDIRFTGNKLYSPETCVFVTQALNSLFLDGGKSRRGEYSQGVTLDKRNGRYIARCSANATHNHIGTYKTEKEASNEYKKVKRDLILTASKRELEPLKSYLVRKAKELTETIES